MFSVYLSMNDLYNASFILAENPLILVAARLILTPIIWGLSNLDEFVLSCTNYSRNNERKHPTYE